MTTRAVNQQVDDEFLSHRLLHGFWLSERRAIQEHRFYLALELKREVSVEETLESWESGVAQAWRRKKMQWDTEHQLREIEKHKYFLSKECGRDIGSEAAAADWVKNYAGTWRDWWEGQPQSSPDWNGSSSE